MTGERVIDSSSRHYDETYFGRYARYAELFAKANWFKFSAFVKATDRTLDFGCGSGELLGAIDCAEKIGVEINESAWEGCRRNGIRVYRMLADIAPASVDIVISNHALEHVPCPLHTVREVYEKLIPGGLAVFVVPRERYDCRYRHDDANQHLYTWCPLNLGNLFKAAGFEIVDARTIFNRWVPKPVIFQRVFGWRIFHIASAINGLLFRSATQVRVVACKPSGENQSATGEAHDLQWMKAPPR